MRLGYMIEEILSKTQAEITPLIMRDAEEQIKLFQTSETFLELETNTIPAYRQKVQVFLDLLQPENVFMRLLHRHYINKGLLCEI